MRIGLLLVLAVSVALSGCSHDEGDGGGDGGYLRPLSLETQAHVAHADPMDAEHAEDACDKAPAADAAHP